MSIYERYVLPRLINLVMQNKDDMTERRRFIPLAQGVVLEVGLGSGINLPFYGRQVKEIYGIDPSRELWRLAGKRVRQSSAHVTFVPSSGEEDSIAGCNHRRRRDDVVIVQYPRTGGGAA